MVIWTYATLQEGRRPLIASYVIPRTSSLDVDIEPFLARRDALSYTDRLQKSTAHPFEVVKLTGKNECVGVVAYCAYLIGTLGRGILEEGRKVLVGLLMEKELVS